MAITNPIHAQLVQCVAEHNAIEDTLYYLSKALGPPRRVIDFNDYLQVCVCVLSVCFHVCVWLRTIRLPASSALFSLCVSLGI